MSVLNKLPLNEQKCQNSQIATPLTPAEVNQYLSEYLPQWRFETKDNIITRKFEFKNYKQTIFFINAVAFICEKECHHPEITFGYNYCIITSFTHDIKGVSINDIILAAKINSLW